MLKGRGWQTWVGGEHCSGTSTRQFSEKNLNQNNSRTCQIFIPVSQVTINDKGKHIYYTVQQIRVYGEDQCPVVKCNVLA